MKALSLRQPYAWLVVQRAYDDDPKKPLKSIENRSWPLPRTFHTPQRVCIHASLTMYNVSLQQIKDKLSDLQWIRCRSYLETLYTIHTDKDYSQDLGYLGCLLGTVVITGQVWQSNDPWFFGPVGFTLESPEMLAEPIPYKGRLGLFDIVLLERG